MKVLALLCSFLCVPQALGQDAAAEEKLQLCIQMLFENELLATPYIVSYEGVHMDDRANVHRVGDKSELGDPRQVTFEGITAKSSNGSIRTETHIDFGGKHVNRRKYSVLSAKGRVYSLSNSEYKEMDLTSQEYEKLERFYEIDPFQSWLLGAEAIRFGEVGPRRSFINFLANKPVQSAFEKEEIVGVWLVNSKTHTYRVVRFDGKTNLPIRSEFGLLSKAWDSQKSSFPFGSFVRITSNKVEWTKRGKAFFPSRVVSERYTKSAAGRTGRMVLSSAMTIDFTWGDSSGLDKVLEVESLKRAEEVGFEAFRSFFR